MAVRTQRLTPSGVWSVEKSTQLSRRVEGARSEYLARYSTSRPDCERRARHTWPLARARLEVLNKRD